MRLLAAAGSATLLVVGLFACSGDDDSSAATTTGAGGQLTGASSVDSSSEAASSSQAASSSAHSSAASSVAASSSHASSSHASSSSSSSSGGPKCMNTDPGEPNNLESTAYDFGPNGCSDSDPGMFYGVLYGASDVDWFRYEGSDDLSCVVNPTQGATVSGSGSVRLCAYLDCDNGLGNTDVTCPNGTTVDWSAAGRPGCCGSSEFTIDLSCGFLKSKSSTVLVRIDDPTHASTCTSYSVSFHF